MAQSIWVNVTLDPSATIDRTQLHHAAVHGTAAAADLTVSYDPTKVKTLTRLQSALDEVVRQIAGSKALTP